MVQQSIVEDLVFEDVLRRLSASAFTCVVRCGVRDINAFLQLDPVTLTDITSGIAEELTSSQHWARQQLGACPVDGAGPGCLANRLLDVPVQLPESKDDSLIYRAMRNDLSSRARRALAVYGRIANDMQFMSLSADLVAGWPGVGPGTVSEILRAQNQMKDAMSGHTKDSRTFSPEHVSTTLTRPTVVAAKPIRQTSSQDRSSGRTPPATCVDEPATWSVLRTTLPHIYGLSEGVIDNLWLAFDTETWADLGLDEPFWTDLNSPPFEWEKLEKSCIYMEDPLTTLLSLSVSYLINTGISAESFRRVIKGFGCKARHCIGNACIKHDTISDQPIVESSDIPGIGGLRIDSFDIPQDLLQVTQDAGILTWKELADLSERSIVDSYGFNLAPLTLIESIWISKSRLRLISNQLESDLPSDSYTSFQTMVTSLIDSVARNGRDTTIMLGRLATMGCRQTLNQLSATVRVTQERVRQIGEKVRTRLDPSDGPREPCPIRDRNRRGVAALGSP